MVNFGYSESQLPVGFVIFKKLTEKGVFCLLTNSNTEYIRELYSDYIISTVNVKRYINCDASGRADCKEIIIQNF